MSESGTPAGVGKTTLAYAAGKRISEKSWASLAPLFDNRRYVESIVAGIKIRAQPLVRTRREGVELFNPHPESLAEIAIEYPQLQWRYESFRRLPRSRKAL